MAISLISPDRIAFNIALTIQNSSSAKRNPRTSWLLYRAELSARYTVSTLISGS